MRLDINAARPAPRLRSAAVRRSLLLTALALLAALAAVLFATAAVAADGETGTTKDKPPSHADATAATRDVAGRYFAAYVDRRWDDLAPLAGEAITFHDPTAELVFGSQRHEGKAALLKLFREGYASITTMRFAPVRRFASGPVAVFEGDLDWTLRLQDGRLVHSVTPIVTTLRVADGRVVEHVDLVDYQPFLDSLARLRREAAGEPPK